MGGSHPHITHQKGLAERGTGVSLRNHPDSRIAVNVNSRRAVGLIIKADFHIVQDHMFVDYGTLYPAVCDFRIVKDDNL